MSRTRKHPPAPDRFTKRNRTSRHAKAVKVEKAIASDTLERCCCLILAHANTQRKMLEDARESSPFLVPFLESSVANYDADLICLQQILDGRDSGA